VFVFFSMTLSQSRRNQPRVGLIGMYRF